MDIYSLCILLYYIIIIIILLYIYNINIIYHIKDPNKSNTQKYFRHSNVKRYELALLRSGYFFYFGRLYFLEKSRYSSRMN